MTEVLLLPTSVREEKKKPASLVLFNDGLCDSTYDISHSVEQTQNYLLAL